MKKEVVISIYDLIKTTMPIAFKKMRQMIMNNPKNKVKILKLITGDKVYKAKNGTIFIRK